jgi:hypothetical protein
MYASREDFATVRFDRIREMGERGLLPRQFAKPQAYPPLRKRLRRPREIAVATITIEWCTAFPSESQPIKPGQEDGSSNGNQNGVNHATVTLKPKHSHTPTAHEGSRDAKQKVGKDSASGATHDLSGCPPRNQAHYYPPQEAHRAFSTPSSLLFHSVNSATMTNGTRPRWDS